MRPQQNAAENVCEQCWAEMQPKASMRPQQNAAENLWIRARTTAHCRRFNEAAAKRCGKPARNESSVSRVSVASMRPQQNAAENGRHRAGRHRSRMASMRPQQNAAENWADCRCPCTSCRRFNEAAAKRCGKPHSCPLRRSLPPGFNEAAAKRCGNPPLFRRVQNGISSCFNEAAAKRCGKPPIPAASSSHTGGLQ